MSRVVVVPYDPAWMIDFQTEAERIRQGLQPLAVRIHHIGSTSIPGMPAKPIIDILLEVDDILALDARTARMQSLGYEAKGEFGIPGRRYFRRNNSDGVRTHHVHAFAAEVTDVVRHLAFRDYMIAHHSEAKLYANLKCQLAARHPDDVVAYMDGKGAFITEYEARAIVWRSALTSRLKPAPTP